MTERETIDVLVARLAARDPFVHVRFGDGDVFFATGTGPTLTADGEEWTPGLRDRLRDAWRTLATYPDLLVGDVGSYLVSDGCEAEWEILLGEAEELRGAPVPLIHIEALRATQGVALPFYLAVAADTRRKAYVAPSTIAAAATMLNADRVDVPLRVAHEVADATAADLAVSDYEVVLFSAGRGGKIMQAALSRLRPDVVQIDVGSGLDALFGGVRRGTDAGADVAAFRRTYAEAGLTVR